MHLNSILGEDLRHGRTCCTTTLLVCNIIVEIHDAYGSVTLHRVTTADRHSGPQFLEAESRLAMMENEDVEEAVDNLGSSCDDVVVRSEIVIATVNVDGGSAYAASPSSRM